MLLVDPPHKVHFLADHGGPVLQACMRACGNLGDCDEGIFTDDPNLNKRIHLYPLIYRYKLTALKAQYYEQKLHSRNEQVILYYACCLDEELQADG